MCYLTSFACFLALSWPQVAEASKFKNKTRPSGSAELENGALGLIELENMKSGAPCMTTAALHSISPLPAACVKFSQNCAIMWDYEVSWPCYINTWAAMKEGFVDCCLGGRHADGTCQTLANEAFASHESTPFPQGATAAFCQVISDLQDTHDDWGKDNATAGTSLVQARSTQDLAETIAKRIWAARERVPELFMHFTAGALVLASGVSMQTAALATLSSAISSHLSGCLGLQRAYARAGVKPVHCQKAWGSWSACHQTRTEHISRHRQYGGHACSALQTQDQACR